jgi:hypothetical protein
MRLKLVFAASVLAAIVGAGSCIARVFGEGIVESEFVGFFDVAVAGGDDCVRRDICLSPHCATT